MRGWAQGPDRKPKVGDYAPAVDPTTFLGRPFTPTAWNAESQPVRRRLTDGVVNTSAPTTHSAGVPTTVQLTQLAST